MDDTFKQIKEQTVSAGIGAGAAKSAADTASTAQREMRVNADETKIQVDRLIAQQQRQADAGRDAVISSEKTLQLDQRAWIVPEGLLLFPTVAQSAPGQQVNFSATGPPLERFTPGQPFYAKLDMKNIGKTPAIDMRTVVVMRYVQIPDRPSLYQRASEISLVAEVALPRYGVPQDVAPQQPAAMPSFDPITNRDTISLTQEQITLITNGETAIYVVALIQYSDIFGQKRETKFCNFYANAQVTSTSCGGGSQITQISAPRQRWHWTE